MANLSRLFKYGATSQFEPIENFCTEALAISIDHDAKPLLRALESVSAPTARQADAASRVQDLASSHVPPQVQTETQRRIPTGFLDLVVTLHPPDGRRQEIWFENKIGAGLSGDDQLDRYLDHLEGHQLGTLLVSLTLDGRPMHDDVPGLAWRDIIDRVVEDSDRWWFELRAFLREQQIVFAPPPPNLNAPYYLPVFDFVNQRVGALWGDLPEPIHWKQPAKMKSHLLDRYERQGGLLTEFGPLVIGLVGVDDTWEWQTWVVDRCRYHRVSVPAHTVKETAQQGGLPSTWEVHPENAAAVLLKRRAWVPTDDPRYVGAWFVEALDEVKTCGALESFIAAQRNKTPDHG